MLMNKNSKLNYWELSNLVELRWQPIPVVPKDFRVTKQLCAALNSVLFMKTYLFIVLCFFCTLRNDWVSQWIEANKEEFFKMRDVLDSLIRCLSNPAYLVLLNCMWLRFSLAYISHSLFFFYLDLLLSLFFSFAFSPSFSLTFFPFFHCTLFFSTFSMGTITDIFPFSPGCTHFSKKSETT